MIYTHCQTINYEELYSALQRLLLRTAPA